MHFLPAFVGLALCIACSKAQFVTGGQPSSRPPNNGEQPISSGHPGSGGPPTGKPNINGQPTSGQPGVGGQSTTGKPNMSGQPSTGTGKPSTSGQLSTGKPNTTGQIGGVQCTIDSTSATLPECILKFFKDGILIDGNNNTCNNNKPVIAAKLTLEQLFAKAEEAVKTGGTCASESTTAKPNGRKKRQGQMNCGTGAGVGNCETGDYRLQSIYGEKETDYGTLIVTNGVPNHCYKNGAEKSVNYVCEHYRALLVPKNPLNSTSFQSHDMGPVGITKSGAFLYNHLSGEATCNAAAITEKITFDTCDGHASPNCQYHYHKAPNCISGFNTCGLLGYTNDGFPFYGKCNITDVSMKSCYKLIAGKNGCDKTHYTFDRATSGCNLDEANGYYFTKDTGSFKAGTYAYFFTPEYPFSMPGYYGSKSQAKWCVISV